MAQQKSGKKRGNRGFKRIRALGPERRASIEDMLLQGYSGYRVAQIIQEDWEQLTDVQVSTLAKQLVRYKKDELEGTLIRYQQEEEAKQEMAEAEGEADELYKRVVLTRRAEDINALNELTELVHVQKERLNKILGRERELPTNMSAVAQDIRLLKDLIKELADLQLETGVLHRAPKNFNANISLHETTGYTVNDLQADRATQDQIADATREALETVGFYREHEVEDGEYTEIGDDGAGTDHS